MVNNELAWRVLGGSVIGTSHIESGIECQDSHAWVVTFGSVCVAIADGAGSRPMSAEGSRVATSAVLEQIGRRREPLGEDGFVQMFCDIRSTLEAHTESIGVGPGSLATTLGVVLITGTQIEIAQVGDTIIVVADGNGVWSVSPETDLEYANQTRFITGDSVIEDFMRYDSIDCSGIRAIAAATDGLRFKILENPAGGTPFRPFFDDLFSFAIEGDASSDSICDFLAMVDDQSGDDKTLVVIVQNDSLAAASLENESRDRPARDQ